MNVSFENLIGYKNKHVLDRYTKDYPNNKFTAEESFLELKKYLWLCHQYKTDKNRYPENEKLQFRPAMYFEMKEIDDMWHTFLLFTKDYMQFCRQFFSTFLHHIPSIDDNHEHLSEEEFEKEFSYYLSYIYDNLGENTVRKWFSQLITD